MSTNPGVTSNPRASISSTPLPDTSPIPTTTPSRTATSACTGAEPDPSCTVPPRTTRSNSAIGSGQQRSELGAHGLDVPGDHLLRHAADRGPEVHGVDGGVAGVIAHPLRDMLGRPVDEVVERVARLARAELVRIDRLRNRSAGALDHVPPIRIALIRDVARHLWPVGVGVVADPALDAAAHPGGRDVVAALDQSIAICRPTTLVDGE